MNEMKYPLRIIKVIEQPWNVAVADANGKIVCHIMAGVWDKRLAEFIVRTANCWHQWRPWFRVYTRNDWLRERNTWK